MIKKIIICLLFVWMPVLTYGQVVINEIMYNLSGADTDREWVEILNTGTEPVTITTGGTNAAWRFSDGSQHTLTLVRGSATLTPGEFAVIADKDLFFLTDWPSFTGNLFDSSFDLGNASGSLAILSSKDGEVLDRASYSSDQGAKGDGNSLQRLSDGSWIVALPTPGLLNATIAYIPPAVASTTDPTDKKKEEIIGGAGGGGGCAVAGSTHSGQVGISCAEVKAPSVGAGRKRYATVGTEIAFESLVKNNGSVAGKYIWTFGDGSSAVGSKTTHRYLFPGIYNVVLNADFNGQEAVSRTMVKVYSPEIKIKQIDSKIGYVELENSATIETNLFGYKLNCDNNSFVFPIDTIIGAKDSLKIPLALTKCLAEVINWNLADQTGKVLFQYQSPLIVSGLENKVEREQAILLIKQKINLVVIELEKLKNQQRLANQSKNLIPREKAPIPLVNQVLTTATPLPDINPRSQTAGIIILDKDPLSTNKSLFSRLKSWFGR